ncbi:hypothetical protein NDU88_008309 [Pleurodeles waltl]|uniref:Uncharacterized protein n=1 Tax=Pleurodeles waltl TaxID=8319 RepID=A0AAV7PSS8_PLEWA|nr:hypothetical protein NDU88_008309 [Pleurodeles waltl]
MMSRASSLLTHALYFCRFCIQITRAVFPQHPSVWRTPFKYGIDQERIVLQPEAAHRHPSSILLPKDPLKNQHAKLDQHVQKPKMTLPAPSCDPEVIDHDSDQPMWQKLQVSTLELWKDFWESGYQS